MAPVPRSSGKAEKLQFEIQIFEGLLTPPWQSGWPLESVNGKNSAGGAPLAVTVCNNACELALESRIRVASKITNCSNSCPICSWEFIQENWHVAIGQG